MKFLFFIIINLFASSLLLVKGKRSTNLWIAGYLITMGLGFFVAEMDYYPKILIIEQTRLAAFCFRLSAWMFTCTYLNLLVPIKEEEKKAISYVAYILLSPVLISLIYDLLPLRNNSIYMEKIDDLNFLILVYVGFGNLLAVFEMRSKYSNYVNASYIFKVFEKYDYLSYVIIFIISLGNLPIYFYAYTCLINGNTRNIENISVIWQIFIIIIVVGLVIINKFFGIKIQYVLSEIKNRYADYGLEENELKVMIDIVEDLSVKQSSVKNNVCEKTVNNIRNKIFKKMKVKKSEELKNEFKKIKEKYDINLTDIVK